MSCVHKVSPNNLGDKTVLERYKAPYSGFSAK